MTTGITIGFSGFVYIYNRLFHSTNSAGILGSLSLIAQQCVIIVLIAYSKKIQMLCKEDSVQFELSDNGTEGTE